MILFNSFLTGYLALFLLTLLFETIIDLVHEKYLKKHGMEIPAEFETSIDGERLARMNHYSIENLRYNTIERLFGKAVFLLILLSGLLPWIAERVAHLPFVFGGLIFIALPSLVSAFAALPFDYYRVFVIEEKYGFNTRTLKL
jgi:STE24 endopeptidase